ncbi:hypothetical protein EUGRSUZ_E03471 [Eucalyptus grandis]|uniref:Uncharacterized protein n=2 Tax=Eucalyptus grandis TaxID=71139 RepID=A0ACC3L1E8_EUCGR|nr:hypothetical protein EUGRSUZ_E03471 [Eucalyptus grandis]
MVEKRRQKGLLLTGDLRLTLKGGVGELQDLIFMDNSSWDSSKKFRIGVKVASGYCENTRIREGITNAFRVKEHRGESSKKHHPPQSKDEVWRLEKIAKDGKSHQKLKEAGIHNVEDFRQQLHMDPQRLRKVLGTSITLKNWDCLIAHAKTCPDWKPSSENPVGMGEHAAVFNNDHHLTSLINDKYRATDQLSSQEKFTGETYSGSMQKNSSHVSEGQIGNLVPVQCNLAPPTCATPVGPEVPQANAGSTVEGHYNDVTARPSQVQSHKTNCGYAMEYAVDGSAPLAARQPIAAVCLNCQFPQGDDGSTSFRPPIQSRYIFAQDAMRSQMFDPSRRMDASTSGCQWSSTLSPSEGDDVMGYLQLDDADDPRNYSNQPNDHTFFQIPPSG